MQGFYTKTFNNNSEILLAVCDEELAGKIFEDGRARIAVSRHFYCDRLCDGNELVARMRTATIINMVGSRCVAIAVGQGFVKRESVLKIGAVEHAQAITAA